MSPQEPGIRNQESPGTGVIRVAIVGRPNVGKSALFNRLAGRRIAIVHDQPGITRDRIATRVEQHGRIYEFFDTGGIGLPEQPRKGVSAPTTEIAEAVRQQAEIGFAVADVILFVVDGQEGLVPLDREIADELRKLHKPVWLVVNKIDHEKHDDLEAEFAALGIEPRIAISAVHGRGMAGIWERLKKTEARPEQDPAAPSKHATKLAIVGRPNVGKSTLINRLLGAERVIVSDVPGTTRDSVDVPMEVEGRPFVLIDTAGIRHNRRLSSSVEVFSKMRSEQSIRRCDLAVIVIDAAAGVTRQDKVIAGYVQDQLKPCMIVVNKWDLNEQKVGGRTRRQSSISEYEKYVRGAVPFLDHAPALFASALQGYRAENLWREIEKIDKARRRQISTGQLNRIFTKAQARMPAPIRHGKRLKIFYAVQDPEAPVPTFVLFVNEARHFDESYGRFLRNCIREHEPYPGCPILLQLRERKREPRRHGHKAKSDRKRTRELSDYL